MKYLPLLTTLALALALAGMCVPGSIQAAEKASGTAAAAHSDIVKMPGSMAGAPLTLDFPSAEIDAVSRAMAAILGRAILVDPRVKGKITLYTDEPEPGPQSATPGNGIPGSKATETAPDDKP